MLKLNEVIQNTICHTKKIFLIDIIGVKNVLNDHQEHLLTDLQMTKSSMIII